MNDPDWLALCEELIRAPSDTLRLVMADWLEENGNTQWAQLIRDSLKEFHVPYESEIHKITGLHQSSQPLRAGGDRFWSYHADFCLRWEKGLPECLSVSEPCLLKRVKDFAVYPFNEVMLSEKKPIHSTDNTRKKFYYWGRDIKPYYPYSLHPTLWVLLSPGRRTNNRAIYSEIEHAKTDLSRACVRFISRARSSPS